MKTLIKGGRVVDPARGLDDFREVLIEDGLVAGLARPGEVGDRGAGAEVIDAGGLVVTPGLIDMHVHLREPGQEYKETIATGTAAAAAGGFAAVAAMPNTDPVNDQASVTETILRRAQASGLARVWPVAAMTRGLLGEEMCEYGELARAGAVAVSDDGRWVGRARVMRRVMENASLFGLRILSHCEETALSAGGSMNEGPTATRLGLGGIPDAAEHVAVYRDIALAELTDCPVHICHVSTRRSVELIRWAKAQGIPVTAETAPHYFTLTDDAVRGYRTEAKMNPPLGNQADLEAVRAGLADGTIDAVATDHAPHSVLEKEVEFDQAAFGIVGLETAVPLTLALVRSGVLSLMKAVACLTAAPARILGVPGGSLAAGQAADLTIIDPDRRWTVEAARFKTLGRNTPFEGAAMTGCAVLTMVQGRITHNIL